MLGLALMMQSPYCANGDKFPSWLTQDTFVSGIEPSQGPAVISILNKLYVFSGQKTSGLHFKVKTSSCFFVSHILGTGTNLNDFYSFDPRTLCWSNLTSQASGNVSGQGFVSFQGFLYLSAA